MSHNDKIYDPDIYGDPDQPVSKRVESMLDYQLMLLNLRADAILRAVEAQERDIRRDKK